MKARERPRIGAVLETCLYATDLDGAGNFYEHVLRLEPFSRSQGRHIFFHCGSAVFLLFQPERTGRSEGDVPAHGSSGPGHVAFAVAEAELSDWRRRFAEEGVEIEAEVSWPAGGVSLYVRDPAGNSVELASPSIWSIPEDELFGGPPRRR